MEHNQSLIIIFRTIGEEQGRTIGIYPELKNPFGVNKESLQKDMYNSYSLDLRFDFLFGL